MSSQSSAPNELQIPDLAGRLADVPLFEHIDRHELEGLASQASIKHLPGHATLSDQQAADHDLYIVVRGHLEVWLDPATMGAPGAAHKVATLFADEVAGELALVDGGVRSARLQAGEEGVSVICIPQAAIMGRCEANPVFGYTLMRNLAAMLALRSRLTALSVQSSPL
jgi:CRP-like cAMP-binding protein